MPIRSERENAIWRFYKQAPFAILDEPTAALDPKAEYEMYQRFHEIYKDIGVESSEIERFVLKRKDNMW